LRAVEESAAALAERIREDSWRSAKYLAAAKLWRLREGLDTNPFEVSRLSLNGISALFMPAETCVSYQLHAKAQGVTAVAAYGDCFLKYVAADEAFDQGGYEVDPRWTEVERGIEGRVKAIMAEAMGDRG
jgi:hypothetical protein